MILLTTSLLAASTVFLGWVLVNINEGDRRTLLGQSFLKPELVRFLSYAFTFLAGLCVVKLIHSLAIIFSWFSMGYNKLIAAAKAAEAAQDELERERVQRRKQRRRSLQKVLSAVEFNEAAILVITLIAIGELAFTTFPLLLQDSKTVEIQHRDGNTITDGLTFLGLYLTTAALEVLSMARNVGKDMSISTADVCVLGSVNETQCAQIIRTGTFKGRSGSTVVPSRTTETCASTNVTLYNVGVQRTVWQCSQLRNAPNQCDPTQFIGDITDRNDGIIVQQSNQTAVDQQHRVCVNYVDRNVLVLCSLAFEVGTADVKFYNDTTTCQISNVLNYKRTGRWLQASRLNQTLTELNVVLTNALGQLVKPLSKFDDITVMGYIGAIYAAAVSIRAVNQEEDPTSNQDTRFEAVMVEKMVGYRPGYFRNWVIASTVVAGLAVLLACFVQGTGAEENFWKTIAEQE